MGTAAIESRGVAKRFGKVEALRGLDFQVEEGSITGFLGLNGAGKTTMLRILAGLSSPTEGEVWLQGQRIDRAESGTRRLTGFLPEAPGFPGWMSAPDVLAYVGSLVGLDGERARTRAQALLDTVGLEWAGKRRVSGFSRGMRQRLGIAQALVHDPPVLLLDEPSSALDPAGRRDVLDLIDRLHGRQTVFLSTHILSDVERICDSVVVIHQGRVVAQSHVAELRRTLGAAVLEIEVTGDAGGLTAALQAAGYVDRVETEGEGGRYKLTVWPSDPDEAAARIPSLLGEGPLLSRYEWVTPDLETVFLNLVGDVPQRSAS